MCDTIVAVSSVTKSGATLFGKNSDREPDEVQNIRIYPRQKYTRGSSVQCTYISIPQVAETNRVLLCQPFWMFGAEMGANEHGVIIGNEAMFTREKPDKTGLTGMDLLRLALERAATAREAMETITWLLGQHGQGGNCGYRHKFYYMNSFLIADPKEAYVLETVKSWWAWKKIRGLYSISNIISLEKDYDACSPGLIENAIKKGYCKSEADFNFRKCYSDRIMTWGAKSAARQLSTRACLKEKEGGLTTLDFMNILRNHSGGPDWVPDKGGVTVCMHAADPLIRKSQSVCSLVGSVGPDNQYFYTTGAPNPCLSPFFPVFLSNTTLPKEYVEGKANFDPAAYWWQSEKLHRRALGHFRPALHDIQSQYTGYEKEMVSSLEEDRASHTQETVDLYFSKAKSIVSAWGERLDSMPQEKLSWLFRRYWRGYNSTDRIEKS